MHGMKPADNPLENDFAQMFLDFTPEKLQLLHATATDTEFRTQFPRLGVTIHRMIQYRVQQLESNLEDACSVQNPHFDQWSDDDLLMGIVGLETIDLLAISQPAIGRWVRVFDRLLVTHILIRWRKGKYSSDSDNGNSGIV